MAFLHLKQDECFIFECLGDEPHAHAVHDGSIEWDTEEVSVTIDHDLTIGYYLSSGDQIDLYVHRDGKRHAFKNVMFEVDPDVEYKLRLVGTYEK